MRTAHEPGVTAAFALSPGVSTRHQVKTMPVSKVLHPSESGSGALLRYASENGDALLVEALIKAGASLYECDSEANTPMHYAARGGHTHICRLLLKAGADAHVCNKAGLGAWDVALLHGKAEVRRMFSPATSDKDTEMWFKDGNPPPT